jgi:hypothetical protein
MIDLPSTKPKLHEKQMILAFQNAFKPRLRKNTSCTSRWFSSIGASPNRSHFPGHGPRRCRHLMRRSGRRHQHWRRSGASRQTVIRLVRARSDEAAPRSLLLTVTDASQSRAQRATLPFHYPAVHIRFFWISSSGTYSETSKPPVLACHQMSTCTEGSTATTPSARRTGEEVPIYC